jgi:myo-inositol-1(or 4)-monophosphatase
MTGTPQDADPGELLRIAREAAAAAGRLLASWRRDGRPEVIELKSSPTDVVTEMDRQSEALITGHIRAVRPADAVLGEEGGQTAGGLLDDGPAGPARVRWVVDPLDGTVNYLYGLPDWAVSIAAEVAGTVVAGVVCVPRRDGLFSAVLGGGAWLQPATGAPRRLACNADVPLARALVATGFGYEPGRRRVQGQVVSAVLPRVRDIRRGGACAVDLCSLAAGQVDGYYERGVHYWDIAAGSLIAREAGAQVAGLCGRPAGTSMTLAAGPALFGELHDLLVPLNPERDE